MLPVPEFTFCPGTTAMLLEDLFRVMHQISLQVEHIPQLAFISKQVTVETYLYQVARTNLARELLPYTVPWFDSIRFCRPQRLAQQIGWTDATQTGFLKCFRLHMVAAVFKVLAISANQCHVHCQAALLLLSPPWAFHILYVHVQAGRFQSTTTESRLNYCRWNSRRFLTTNVLMELLLT